MTSRLPSRIPATPDRKDHHVPANVQHAIRRIRTASARRVTLSRSLPRASAPLTRRRRRARRQVRFPTAPPCWRCWPLAPAAPRAGWTAPTPWPAWTPCAALGARIAESATASWSITPPRRRRPPARPCSSTAATAAPRRGCCAGCWRAGCRRRAGRRARRRRLPARPAHGPGGRAAARDGRGHRLAGRRRPAAGDRARGRPARARSTSWPVPSAQVKSALLLAGLRADGETIVDGGGGTRDHTERMLHGLGVGRRAGTRATACWSRRARGLRAFDADRARRSLRPPPSSRWPPPWCRVRDADRARPVPEPDPHRRAGRAARAPAPGSRSSGRRSGRSARGEPAGDVTRRSRHRCGPSRSAPTRCPALVDEIPVLAVLATACAGTTVISGAGELRVKESRSPGADGAQPARLGADVDERARRPDHPRPHRAARRHAGGAGPLTTGGDHRIAMALAVAALITDGESALDDDGLRGRILPEFFRTLDDLLDAEHPLGRPSTVVGVPGDRPFTGGGSAFGPGLVRTTATGGRPRGGANATTDRDDGPWHLSERSDFDLPRRDEVARLLRAVHRRGGPDRAAGRRDRSPATSASIPPPTACTSAACCPSWAWCTCSATATGPSPSWAGPRPWWATPAARPNCARC